MTLLEGLRLNQRENQFLAFQYKWNNERIRVLSGGGLTFNGDTATTNALDDYEEGTWVPEVWRVLAQVRQY